MWIVLAIACIGIALANFFYLLDTVSFKIPDRCGVMVSSVMHTIDDPAVCNSRCRGQCEAQGMLYSGSEYADSQKGCNDCTCSCKSLRSK